MAKIKILYKKIGDKANLKTALNALLETYNLDEEKEIPDEWLSNDPGVKALLIGSILEKCTWLSKAFKEADEKKVDEEASKKDKKLYNQKRKIFETRLSGIRKVLLIAHGQDDGRRRDQAKIKTLKPFWQYVQEHCAAISLDVSEIPILQNIISRKDDLMLPGMKSAGSLRSLQSHLSLTDEQMTTLKAHYLMPPKSKKENVMSVKKSNVPNTIDFDSANFNSIYRRDLEKYIAWKKGTDKENMPQYGKKDRGWVEQGRRPGIFASQIIFREVIDKYHTFLVDGIQQYFERIKEIPSGLRDAIIKEIGEEKFHARAKANKIGFLVAEIDLFMWVNPVLLDYCIKWDAYESKTGKPHYQAGSIGKIRMLFNGLCNKKSGYIGGQLGIENSKINGLQKRWIDKYATKEGRKRYAAVRKEVLNTDQSETDMSDYLRRDMKEYLEKRDMEIKKVFGEALSLAKTGKPTSAPGVKDTHIEAYKAFYKNPTLSAKTMPIGFLLDAIKKCTLKLNHETFTQTTRLNLQIELFTNIFLMAVVCRCGAASTVNLDEVKIEIVKEDESKRVHVKMPLIITKNRAELQAAGKSDPEMYIDSKFVPYFIDYIEEIRPAALEELKKIVTNSEGKIIYHEELEELKKIDADYESKIVRPYKNYQGFLVPRIGNFPHKLKKEIHHMHERTVAKSVEDWTAKFLRVGELPIILSPHRYRDAVATSIVRLKKDLVSAAFVLGDKISTIVKHYAHLLDQDGFTNFGELIKEASDE